MEKIEQLQKYYSRAIRGNHHDLEGMKKAVLAILCHYVPPASKDLAHQHRFCPSGPTYGKNVQSTFFVAHEL